jgi:hypothetical protein
MSITRRGFLKIAGAMIAAPFAAKLILPAAPAIAAPPPSAPLYIPKERLELGVPRHWRDAISVPDAGRNIPMVLLQANFMQEYGGRLPEGAELLVDRTTAERWIEYGVARAGTQAPSYLQEASAKRMAERAERTSMLQWDNAGVYDLAEDADDAPGDGIADGSWHEDQNGLWYRPTQWETQSSATMNDFMRRFALGED